jgi:hypothetical protein
VGLKVTKTFRARDPGGRVHALHEVVEVLYRADSAAAGGYRRTEGAPRYWTDGGLCVERRRQGRYVVPELGLLLASDDPGAA